MDKIYQTASKDGGLEAYVINTPDNKYRSILRDTDAKETAFIVTFPTFKRAVDLCEEFTTGVKR